MISPPRTQRIGLVVFLAIAFAGFVVWSIVRRVPNEAEVKKQLMEAGALVVMDSDGAHVGTVALSTIRSEAELAKALELMGDLRSVKALDMNRLPIENVDLQIISTMTSLVSLSLNSTGIDDEGLTHLAKLSGLESLHLNKTAISDSGLQKLTSLQNLKVLDLSGTLVKDDLTPLAQLPDLQWLVLGELSLAEDALDQVALLPSLNRLTLLNSTYPESALDELRSKRPEIRIDQ